jgi:hypothetical protein
MAFTKIKDVQARGWRTLESGWNTEFWVSFLLPKNAQIKVRYGGGWISGWDSQKQTLDGELTKILKVSKHSSKVYARIQVYVQQNTEIAYTYYPSPFDGLVLNF